MTEEKPYYFYWSSTISLSSTLISLVLAGFFSIGVSMMGWTDE